MRWAVDGRRLLGGMEARESAMRYAVVNVTVGNSAAAVHGIGVTHKHGLVFRSWRSASWGTRHDRVSTSWAHRAALCLEPPP